MVNIFIAFITGLTTGGLSCLAVQGGLLASSLANQIEKDLQIAPQTRGKKRAPVPAQNRIKLARPIMAFLISKLLVYTLLGFLLGLVGQMFQLSPYARAFLQIAIGIFMLGSALRMLNVHPIFRYFAFEPPAFLRRKLRRTAAQTDGASLAAPIFLGALTVLIPCGVTQAMMAVALGTADPLEGAALMFAFTLGTSPVFFAVTYFATQLGSKLEKQFMRFVAVTVLVLAVITIDSGITLAGSPVSLGRFLSGIFNPSNNVVAAPARQELKAFVPAAVPTFSESDRNAGAQVDPNSNIITINVENYGYNPAVINAKAGVPIKLRLVTNNVRSCSRAFVIPSLGVQRILEETGEVYIDIPAQRSGAEIPFSCSMGMYWGTILFN